MKIFMYALVLEREEDGRRLLQRTLIELGLQVVAFATGEDALAWLRENPAELAIIGLYPWEDITKVCVQMRHLRNDLRILVVAGSGDRDLARGALQECADDYLLKPVDLEQLEQKLSVLSRQQS